MKSKLVLTLCASAALVCALAAGSINPALAAAPSSKQQDDKAKDKDKPAPISEGEQQALNKINTATTAADKLKAANEYAKKYNKSTKRMDVAKHVAFEIGKTTDHAQRLTLAADYNKTFNQPAEADLIKPALIESYFNTNKFDEALTESQKYLEKNPNDVFVHTQIAWAAATQAQKQAATPKLMQAGTQSAAKSVELMEQDKMPEGVDAEYWKNYRNAWLPRLYQAHGVMLMAGNDKAKAREMLEKAAGIDQYDPPTLMMLVNLSNEEYQELAKQYQTNKKSDLLNQAVAKMDETIDWMARAVAATEGNAQYQQLNSQLRDNLKQYYEFRHEGKLDGMKELIEKYKKK